MIKKLLIAFSVILVISLSFVLWVWLQIPTDQEIKGCLVTKMYAVNLCPGSKDYVPLKQISPFLQKAIVLSEDSMFWQHNGFDWESIEKNAKENWEKGAYLRGGSTITQQLAKNMFLSKEKSLMRKGLEALITLRLEKVLTKKEILERYLNVIEFGGNIYGVKAAARHYFEKAPADLDPVEAAFLAMLLPNPVKYASSHQKKNLTKFARGRVNKILADMARTGKMSEEEYGAAQGRLDYFLDPNAAPPPETDAEFGMDAPTNQDFMDSPPGEPAPSPEQFQTDPANGDIHDNPAGNEQQTNVESDSPAESD